MEDKESKATEEALKAIEDYFAAKRNRREKVAFLLEKYGVREVYDLLGVCEDDEWRELVRLSSEENAKFMEAKAASYREQKAKEGKGRKILE